jgi:8-oxo-dGTP pyrophosphatase MutT (NUDIX family)
LFKRTAVPIIAPVLTVAHVAGLLRDFDPRGDARAAASLARVQDLLARSPAPFARTTYQPGHVTASGVVLSPDRASVLLVYHRRLQRWLQPGGHIEPEDGTVAEAACREVREETGIRVLDYRAAPVVGVDVHPIPAARGEPPHWHHDVALGFVARKTRLRPTEEVREAVWCAVDGLDRYAVGAGLRRSVERALGVAGR